MTRRSFSLTLILGLLLATLAPLAASAQPAERETRQTSFDPSTINLELETVLEGFELPAKVTNAGDGSDRLFVSELAGVVRVAVDGEVLPEPFLDISDIVRDEDGEQGFFGVAFHPQYEENGQFYAVYTKQPDGDNVLARFTVSTDDPNRADRESLTEVIVLDDQFANHNGGDLAFGPDGYLYYGTGDEGGDGDLNGNAQNSQSLHGKMLRIDVDSGDPYAIPADNPFVDDPDVRDEIWATGLRNPFRYSFDRETGDLYIGDVGQNMWEEVDFQPAASAGGENYGWPIMEGSHCYPEGSECEATGLTLPILEYSHEGGRGVQVGCTVTGGYVYRGEETPFMDGVYIFGDWCEGRIFAGWRDDAGEWRMEELLDTFIMMTSFGEDEAGELYLTDMLGGSVLRLRFSQTAPRPQIDSISPESLIAGSDTFTLTINGRNFSAGSVVHWDGTDLPTSFVDNQTITATVDAALITIEGSARIGIIDGDFTSNEVPFIIRSADGPEATFERAWQRTDLPVASGAVARTWVWGPASMAPVIIETYSDAPSGKRAVQYYDKARMEVTNPDDGDPSSPWYVTNGLLVVEMMSGEVQLGHNQFEPREPAEINIAGDMADTDGVGYATLATLLDATPYGERQTVTAVLGGDGSTSDDPNLGSHGVTAGQLAPETGHRTASVFWNFMIASGLVMEDGQLVEGLLFDGPYYATGLPVTEAYWTYIDVGGTEKLMLLQCFERRCLTYTPDNPAGWQVEAGNVGRHYHTWRYGE